MPAGSWAFLHETVIYEYMMDRYRDKQLRLKQVISNGKPLMKDKILKVEHLQEITDTFFPDIESITIKGDARGARPSEVKFVTSSFGYHKGKSIKDIERYNDFICRNGCIIVLQHDYLPNGIVDDFPVDVFEIDLVDFISYGTENFVRFLNRQIKAHNFEKIWLMYQGKNFWYGNDLVPSAMESGRWSPTENLTSFDLAVGDKVVFIRTSGCGQHDINSFWYGKGVVPEKWRLNELFISRVTHPIKSRDEYCKSKGIPDNIPLWYDETEISRKDNRIQRRKGIRWKRVFEFKLLSYFMSLDIDMQELYELFPQFTKAVADVFTNRGSREIKTGLYTAVIEHIASVENKRRNEIVVYNQIERINSSHPELPEYH